MQYLDSKHIRKLVLWQALCPTRGPNSGTLNSWENCCASSCLVIQYWASSTLGYLSQKRLTHRDLAHAKFKRRVILSSVSRLTEARLVQTWPHQLGAFYVGSACLRTCSSLKFFSLDTRFTPVSQKHRLPSGRRCQLVYLMMRHDITCVWSCFQKLMFICEIHLSISHAGKYVLEAQLRWIFSFFSRTWYGEEDELFIPSVFSRVPCSKAHFRIKEMWHNWSLYLFNWWGEDKPLGTCEKGRSSKVSLITVKNLTNLS